jgi:DNA helicase-2/ATP-dependent DNA helicase PcrA
MQATIEKLMDEHGFRPNENQLAAIKHFSGPLFLMAGPGSGKTRVLLWRTVNLMVFHGVKPEKIFLSTFTEKAARQLQDGLRAYLSAASKHTGKLYDTTPMFVGTTHSLCQRILTDRRFAGDQARSVAPRVLDEVEQHFAVNNGLKRRIEKLGLDDGTKVLINAAFNSPQKVKSNSTHESSKLLISMFSRFGEEMIDPKLLFAAAKRKKDEPLRRVSMLYEDYLKGLADGGMTDFSHMQSAALNALKSCLDGDAAFDHVIVDEYQDTNSVQESIYFELARSSGNLCVVGDDDQALYRFRGATVENFVQFKQRVKTGMGVKAVKSIPLDINYRSRRPIVEFYTKFIAEHDWSDGRKGAHRIEDKKIRAGRLEDGAAVYRTDSVDSADIADEVADKVRQIIDSGVVTNPNQVAFLYPSLGSKPVQEMIAALAERGLEVYAPRAGSFLEQEEPILIYGLLARILGADFEKINKHKDYNPWFERALLVADEAIAADKALEGYVKLRKAQALVCVEDYQKLTESLSSAKVDFTSQIKSREALTLAENAALSGVSMAAIRKFLGTRDQVNVAAFIKRATATDWGFLDLFYQLCGFSCLSERIAIGESGQDEGPLYNLSKVTSQLARFADERGPVISGKMLADGAAAFFNGYLYSLFRLDEGEAEIEDEESSFPLGRIPFLTIHQSKGLEFPVVVVGNLGQPKRQPSKVEALIRTLVDKSTSEPLDRIDGFDAMRKYYVALSRAQELLIVCNIKRARMQEFDGLVEPLPVLKELHVKKLALKAREEKPLPRAYSFTADYMSYERCPRQYMFFRRHGFTPAHTQTMFFGSLVHKTLEDLHNHIISLRDSK